MAMRRETRALERPCRPGGVRLAIGALICLLALGPVLSGCAQAPIGCRPCPAAPRPRLEVFAAPASPVIPYSQRALLLPLRLTPVQANTPEGRDWASTLTGLLKDVLLQQLTFASVEIFDETGCSTLDRALDAAARRGFGLVLAGEVPLLTQPTDVAPGRVALRLEIWEPANRSTIWSLYAEVDLCARPGRDFFVWERPHRPAPSLVQGFMAIARRVADALVVWPAEVDPQEAPAMPPAGEGESGL